MVYYVICVDLVYFVVCVCEVSGKEWFEMLGSGEVVCDNYVVF